MYTLLLLTLYSVWGLGHGTGSGGVTNADINKCYCYNRRGRQQLRETLSAALEPATMFALAPAAGDMEEVSWAGGGEDAVCCVSLSWC